MADSLCLSSPPSLWFSWTLYSAWTRTGTGMRSSQIANLAALTDCLLAGWMDSEEKAEDGCIYRAKAMATEIGHSKILSLKF